MFNTTQLQRSAVLLSNTGVMFLIANEQSSSKSVISLISPYCVLCSRQAYTSTDRSIEKETLIQPFKGLCWLKVKQAIHTTLYPNRNGNFFPSIYMLIWTATKMLTIHVSKFPKNVIFALQRHSC